MSRHGLRCFTRTHRVTEVEENKPLTYEHGLGLIAFAGVVMGCILCLLLILNLAPKG